MKGLLKQGIKLNSEINLSRLSFSRNQHHHFSRGWSTTKKNHIDHWRMLLRQLMRLRLFLNLADGVVICNPLCLYLMNLDTSEHVFHSLAPTSIILITVQFTKSIYLKGWVTKICSVPSDVKFKPSSPFPHSSFVPHNKSSWQQHLFPDVLNHLIRVYKKPRWRSLKSNIWFLWLA